jgi:hypothetical protein
MLTLLHRDGREKGLLLHSTQAKSSAQTKSGLIAYHLVEYQFEAGSRSS